MMNKDNPRTYRVSAFLDRYKLDFLDTIEKDIYFTHGIHVPRSKLIEEIIDSLMKKGTINKTDIEHSILDQIKNEEKK